MNERNERGYGTYEDLGNGWTKDGEVADDYKEAGRDPDLPRQSPAQIEQALKKLLPEG
jgi:hypothetical protein